LKPSLADRQLPPLPYRRPGLDARTALAAWVIALGIGALSARCAHADEVGGARRRPVRRDLPQRALIVQMFLWFFVVPELLPRRSAIGSSRCPRLGLVHPCVLCLASLLGARRRAGPRRHRLAAARPAHGRHRDGLTEAQAYRYVILPHASASFLPPLTSEFMNIIKNSSVR